MCNGVMPSRFFVSTLEKSFGASVSGRILASFASYSFNSAWVFCWTSLSELNSASSFSSSAWSRRRVSFPWPFWNSAIRSRRTASRSCPARAIFRWISFTPGLFGSLFNSSRWLTCRVHRATCLLMATISASASSWATNPAGSGAGSASGSARRWAIRFFSSSICFCRTSAWSSFSRSRMTWPETTLGPTPGSDSAGWSPGLAGGGCFFSSSCCIAVMLSSMSLSRVCFRFRSASTTSLKNASWTALTIIAIARGSSPESFGLISSDPSVRSNVMSGNAVSRSV